jgi:hypothetical protein
LGTASRFRLLSPGDETPRRTKSEAVPNFYHSRTLLPYDQPLAGRQRHHLGVEPPRRFIDGLLLVVKLVIGVVVQKDQRARGKPALEVLQRGALWVGAVQVDM